MTDWNKAFELGKSLLQGAKQQAALTQFNQAVELGGDYRAYEYRAATHEKLGNTKQALLDAQKAINLAPNRWQNYARAAGLFLSIKKHEAAISMVGLALARLESEDVGRTKKLVGMKEEAVKLRDAEKLKQEKQQEERRLARSQKAYHFGKLPVETIVIIFEDVVHMNPNNVLHLARICGQWRQIAFSAPSLWTSLHLRSTIKKPEKKFQLWVEQCRGHLQRLELGDHWTSRPPEFSWSALTSLQLEGASAVFFRGYCTSSGKVLPPLTALDLSYTQSSPDEYAEDEAGNCYWCPVLLPTLKHVRLKMFLLSWKGIPDRLTQLISLDVEIDKVERRSRFLMDLLLTNSTTLEQVSLRGAHLHSDALNPLPPTVFGNLLDFRLFNGLPVGDLFTVLQFPSLHLLTLSIPSLDKALNDLCENNQSNHLATLTTLTLSKVAIHPATLTHFLKQANSLTTLTITHTASTINELVEVFAKPSYTPTTKGLPLLLQPIHIDNNAEILCPHLTYLNLSHCPDVKTGPLQRMIKGRLRNPQNLPSVSSSDTVMSGSTVEVHKELPSSIQTLIVDGCPNIEADLLPWFKANVPNFSCIYMTKKAAKYRR